MGQYTHKGQNTYKCGNRVPKSDDGPGSPNVTVTLTIDGELLMIHVVNIIIYTYVYMFHYNI